MSTYGILESTFWTRGTGKELRGYPAGQIIALYLSSAPTSNMVGLYYLPFSTIVHDTGIAMDGVKRAMAKLVELGFCEYDESTEVVFVKTMARRRLRVDDDHPIKATIPKPDHRHRSVVKLAKECGSRRLLQSFWESYNHILSLPDRWWDDLPDPDPDQNQDQKQKQSARAQEPLASPLQAPSKGHGRRSAIELPADWKPSSALCVFAQKHGRDADRVAETMRAWAESHGEKRTSWDGTFRTFVLKSEERGESPASSYAAANNRAKQTEISLEPSADALSPEEHAEQLRKLTASLSGAFVPPGAPS